MPTSMKEREKLKLVLVCKINFKCQFRKSFLLIPFTFHYETLVLSTEHLRREVEKMQ